MPGKIFSSLLASFLLFVSPQWANAGKSAILFIGDGMGSEIIRALKLKMHGGRAGNPDGLLPFETVNFTVRSSVSTAAADNPVPDSASSATAMATGVKVNKGVLSVSIPGDASPLPTIAELAAAKGLAVGLISTASVTDATPAAFASHRISRKDRAGVAEDYLKPSGPLLLMGGGDSSLNAEVLQKAGFTILPCSKESETSPTPPPGKRLSLLCGADDMPYMAERPSGMPGLAELTSRAVAFLEPDPDGFFLLVEAGRIDDGAHEGNLGKTLIEAEELLDAVNTALKWAQGKKDILIAVTADHDTGGLVLDPDSVTARGSVPAGTFTTGGHTSRKTDFFAAGTSGTLPAEIENTSVFVFLKAFLLDPPETMK